MAIFDSNKKQYLSFYVHLTDDARVKVLQAQYPKGQNKAPLSAAIEHSAPWKGYTEPSAASAPFSWSPWAKTSGDDRPYPVSVAKFSRHTGGFLGIGGTTVTYYWMGQFVLAADATVPPGDPLPGEEANIPARRWAIGFEVPGVDGPPVGTSTMAITRDAARHAGGFGLALRGVSNLTIEVPLNTHTPGYVSAKSWERFYIRLRRKPDVTAHFWRWYGSPSAGVGHILSITAAGELALYYSDAMSATNFIQTIPGVTLEVWDGDPKKDVWRRVDILLNTAKVATPQTAELRIYVDGELKLTRTDPGQDEHKGSRFGTGQTEQTNLFLDIDDWINADIPTRMIGGNVVERLNGKDWTAGTKIVALKATGFGTGHGAWAGDYRLTRQNSGGINSHANITLSSSTSGDPLVINTDTDVQVDGDKGAIGVASVGAHWMGTRGVTDAAHRLGVSLNGAAAQMKDIGVAASITARSVFFTNQTTAPEGDTRPALADVTPIVVRMTKNANAEAATTALLMGSAEMIGKWGKADYTPEERTGMTQYPIPGGIGTHNGPYPRSPWAQIGLAPPIAPYLVLGGTYTGNGTGQDINFRAPIQFFFTRPLSGNTGGYMLWAPAQSSRREFSEGAAAQLEAEEDVSFAGGTGENAQQQQYRIRIAGNHSQSNALGVTYQYVAISDPAMRYMLMGTMAQKGSNPLASHVWKTVAPNFLAEFAMLLMGAHNAGTANRLIAKSAGGLAGSSVANFGGGTTADALDISVAGQLTALANLASFGGGNAAQDQSYMLFRRSDGNKAPTEAAVVFFGSYIGDGSASRSVNLAPASGRRPMFLMIFPGAGTGFWRDPSHTGSNSSANTGLESATGITSGGVDAFSVGSSLNTNAVVYTYFGLYGIADCTSNNGWGCNGEHGPEPEAPPEGGAYPPLPPEPTEPLPGDGGGGGGGGPFPGGPGFPGGPPVNPVDFSVACYAWSTYMVNVALSRIGVSKQIGDIRTEVSEEAFKGRLIYAMDVEQVLRDHHWPFATRYADLTLLGGTAALAVNRDWQYSYRAPADFLMARRIVGQDGQQRTYDIAPPTFKVGTDAIGYLIFTNAAATLGRPVHLEYTGRMSCPAQQGDPLFRSALAWKLASSLALTIARDSKKAEECEVMYRTVLREAKTVASQEQQHDIRGGDAPWITGR